MTADRRAAPPPAETLDGPAFATAPPEVRALYEEVTAHLRVPYLSPFWRALAGGDALATLWPVLRPVLATGAFEREAAALRRASLIAEAAEMSTHQAFKGDLVRAEIDFEMRDRIGNYNAAVHYALAKTLLAAACVQRLLNGGTPANNGEPVAQDDDTIPLGIAAGAVPVPPVPQPAIRGRLAELFEEIPRAHGHPILDDYYRAVGNAPDYLNASWNAIKPVVGDEIYDERANRLTTAATEAAARLPLHHGRGALPSEGVTERLGAAVRYFAARHLPDMLIDLAMIKGIHDGPDDAGTNRYDLPGS